MTDGHWALYEPQFQETYHTKNETTIRGSYFLTVDDTSCN